MKNFLLLLLLVFGINYSSSSQDTASQIKRNVIKGSVATMGVANSMVSIDYERNIVHSEHLRFNVEVTYGKFYRSYTENSYQSYPGFHSFTTSINSLFGRKSSYLELSLGIRYSFVDTEEFINMNPYFPVMNIGYRYQNPYGKGLVFKPFFGTTGIGLSIGKAF
jgi:hypothetical protein